MLNIPCGRWWGRRLAIPTLHSRYFHLRSSVTSSVAANRSRWIMCLSYLPDVASRASPTCGPLTHLPSHHTLHFPYYENKNNLYISLLTLQTYNQSVMVNKNLFPIIWHSQVNHCQKRWRLDEVFLGCLLLASAGYGSSTHHATKYFPEDTLLLKGTIIVSLSEYK